MSLACWALPNEGYVAVGPLSSSLAIVTEGNAPIRFLVNQVEDARLYDGVWRFRAIPTPGFTDKESWLDSSYKTYIDVPAEILQSRRGLICSQTNTVTVANTTTPTSLVGSGFGTTALPANFLATGKTFRLSARGTIEDTGNPNIEVKLLVGGTTLLTTGANPLTIAAGTFGWEVDIIFTYRGGNKMIGQGWLKIDNTLYAMIGTEQTVSATSAHTIDLTVEWGTADPANTISSTNFVLEV